jgi:crossover junction endodeoxyribonuclease RuvC
MIILGIDPGTRRIGYGVVEKERHAFSLLSADILKITSKDDAGALEETKRQIDALITTWNPAAMAIEKLFFAKNQKTAMQVAQSRGVIILAAKERGLPIYEYAPNEVKLRFTGFGGADKKAIAKMVRLTFNAPDLKILDDATDALAIAVCALQDGR